MKAAKRRVLYFTGGLVATLLLLVLAPPLWMPWLLATIAPRYGVNYRAYQREGSSRFVLQSVPYTNKNVVISAERVRLLLPTVWEWRALRSENSEPFAEATDWRVTVLPSENSTNKSELSTYTIFQEVTGTMRGLQRWIPTAHATNGALLLGTERFVVATLQWKTGSVAAVIAPARVGNPFQLEAMATTDGILIAMARYAPLDVTANVRFSASGNQLLGNVTVDVLTNRVTALASFDRNNTLPESLMVECRAFRFAGAQLKLDDYADIHGKLSFAWLTNSFSADLQAFGTPVTNSDFPPLDVSVHSSGDLTHIDITQFRARILEVPPSR